MLKRLEVDALRADLEAISALIERHSEAEDRVGRHQFLARKAMVEQQLAGAIDRPAPPAVGLFFGGGPVRGSRGIVAEFGSKAIEQFQLVIATRFASLDGPISARGPVPQRRQTQMLVTDVARGSFGFVLEAASSDDDDDDHTMKQVISEVVDLLYRASDQDTEIFDEVIADLDSRTLMSLQAFYRLLDGSDATLRLVENERDLRIDRDDVRRGRERVEAISSISSEIIRPRGRLYVMPSSMKFELMSPGGELMRGAVTEDSLRSLPNEEGNIGVGASGTWCNVEIEATKITLRGRAARYSYKLLRVLSSGDLTPDPTS
jgi:hypothetical protein